MEEVKKKINKFMVIFIPYSGKFLNTIHFIGTYNYKTFIDINMNYMELQF